MRLERSALVNIVVVALALASGLTLVLTRDKTTTTELGERDNNLFVVFRADELTAIDARLDGERYRLELARAVDGGQRRYTLAGQGAADPESAESFVRALELAAFFKRFQGQPDRAAFGLERPRAELALHFGNSVAKLWVGKDALTPSGTTYVEIERGGGRVHGLVRSSSLKELLVHGDDLRPRSLVSIGLSELARLEFRDGDRELKLRRGRGAAWLDAAGQRVRREAVENLMFELATVKALEFVESNRARAALDHDGALTAKFAPKSGAELTIRVGSSCPSRPELLLAEKLGPHAWTACIAGGVRNVFTATAQALADPAPFALRMDEVETLLIVRDGKKLELSRSERGFQLRAPALAEVALDAGNQRISALLGVQGEPLAKPDLGQLGLGVPHGSVTLRSSAVEGSERFEESLDLGGVDASGRLAVRRREDGQVLLLARDDARPFTVDSTLLRSTKLFDFGPSELVALGVEWDHERELLRAGANGTFELVEPANAEVEGALALELVQALGTLEALRWVAETDDGSFGLEKPSAEARLTLKPKAGRPSSALLEFGKPTPGGVFAALDTQPGVFVAPRSLLDSLTTLLLSRAPFSQDPLTLERLELERRGKRIVLTRRGATFQASPDLAEPVVSGLVERIASLRAVAAVHTGPARPDEGLATPLLSARITPSNGKGSPRSFRIGTADVYRDLGIHYARVDGIDATFALPESAVRGLLGLF